MNTATTAPLGADLDSSDDTRPASLVAELAGAAGALDAAAAAAESPAVQLNVQQPAAPGAPAAPTIDWRAEAHDLVDFTTGMFFPLYPRLATVWTAERCSSLETRLAAVLEKHNLSMGVLLGKWAPEIMLVATIAPAVMPSVQAIRQDHRDAVAAATEKARAAPPRGQADAPAPPQPAVRTAVQSTAQTAAPPDPTRLHERAGGPEVSARPAPDELQLHARA